MRKEVADANFILFCYTKKS